ncbi:SLAP domain-containing protein [Lactobacillus agrestimuris]|uniref:SLAP domain-containing protein n=1 Tax=Lactobacillus agrestimuris TaxID=2941328 RepID=UPI00199679E8|nr:GH25 family lysozyme [Lactobacillus agrestimuris]MBD5431874.1 lysin [Lactobacillus sp.]
MHKSSKKVLNVLACASVLATTAISVNAFQNDNSAYTVNAAKKKRRSVVSRSYGVDVANYQSSSLKSHANAGAAFAIVKVSEGVSYRNPKAAAQISSAKANGMLPMAYHFALFGAKSASAKAEANYAIASAKAFGLPKGSYIACDWETGDGNNVNGGKNASANAIIAFMKKVKSAGYKPLLYSGASLLNNNINTAKVNSAFPNSLWVASYATMGRIDNPDFNYFPSMDGVAIWQFTDNWRGLNVDGNISLLPLSYGSASSQAPKASSISTKKTVMSKSYVYDKNGQRKGTEYRKAYSKVNVLGGAVAINGVQYYRIGENSYIKLENVDGAKRILKHTASVYDKNGRLVSGTPSVAAGTTVATYGNPRTINNKSYYRVNKGRYILVSDFN